MNRHYYIGDDLAVLHTVEKALMDQGITRHQVHVLSHDSAGAQQQGLHQVSSLMRNDAVRSAAKASLFGAMAAFLILFVAAMTALPATVGWVPFVFLAIVALGLITWEGGLRGVHATNQHFRRFNDALARGRHVMYVDLNGTEQEAVLARTIENLPELESAGSEQVTTDLLINVENGVSRFAKWGP